jgi:hypothetical protein
MGIRLFTAAKFNKRKNKKLEGRGSNGYEKSCLSCCRPFNQPFRILLIVDWDSERRENSEVK